MPLLEFVDGIVALNLDLISKLRRDADARYLYPGPYGGRGRGAPRRHAGKVDWTCRDPAVFVGVASPGSAAAFGWSSSPTGRPAAGRCSLAPRSISTP